MKPDMMKVTRCIWFVFLSGLSSVLPAQENRVEELSTLQARYLENLYYGSTGADRNFINGSVYQEHMRVRGHPFFQEGNWMTGRLVMNGISYDQLPLKYDIYTDHLLYNHILQRTCGKNHEEKLHQDKGTECFPGFFPAFRDIRPGSLDRAYIPSPTAFQGIRIIDGSIFPVTVLLQTGMDRFGHHHPD